MIHILRAPGHHRDPGRLREFSSLADPESVNRFIVWPPIHPLDAEPRPAADPGKLPREREPAAGTAPRRAPGKPRPKYEPRGRTARTSALPANAAKPAKATWLTILVSSTSIC